jgi:hypothetical protein
MKRILSLLTFLVITTITANAGNCWCPCTSCPLISVTQTGTGQAHNNGTPCDNSDDKLKIYVKVTHQAGAWATGDGKFTITVGSNTYGPFKYSTQNTDTTVHILVPVGTSNNTTLTAQDLDYSSTCVVSGTLSCGTFTGISDKTPPTVIPGIPPSPINLLTGNCNTCVPITCGARAIFTTPTATDACGPVTVSINNPGGYQSGDIFPVGTTTITYTFTDANGNSSVYNIVVNVADNTRPDANCKNITLNIPPSGTATIDADDIDNHSTDNCGIVSKTVSRSTFTCADVNTTKAVTLVVEDAAGNKDSCVSYVTVTGQPCQNTGCPTSCSVTVTPCNSTYTGGNPKKIYMGYGPQTVTLTANSTAGANCTYQWTPCAGLTGTSSKTATFTPTAPGNYVFTVTITCPGCPTTTTCTVNVCVSDIREKKNGQHTGKVLLCHVPPGNPANAHTISISPNAVAAHIGNHAGDALGSCNQTCAPSGSTKMLEGDDEGVGELVVDEDLEMVVFPNPTRSEFHLQIESVATDVADVLVYDLSGRMVERTQAHTNADVVVGTNLTPGVYFIEVRHGDLSKKIRVIKL